MISAAMPTRSAGSKAAVDVHYDDAQQLAWVAAVVFVDWTADRPDGTRTREQRGIAPYVSGQFYRRELPCLLPLLEDLRGEVALESVIVDGHVDLGSGRPGLGRYLFEAMKGEVEIIGVAKSPFRGSPALPLYRGRSRRPLWVSATGCVETARINIARMHGPSRLPTLLRMVDRMARSRSGREGAGATKTDSVVGLRRRSPVAVSRSQRRCG